VVRICESAVLNLKRSNDLELGGYPHDLRNIHTSYVMYIHVKYIYINIYIYTYINIYIPFHIHMISDNKGGTPTFRKAPNMPSWIVVHHRPFGDLPWGISLGTG
jgi:hypothetical protein